MRIAVIYFLSGIVGSLFAVLFVRNIPSISSGAAFFGLIGAMLSALAKNWNLYTGKVKDFLCSFYPWLFSSHTFADCVCFLFAATDFSLSDNIHYLHCEFPDRLSPFHRQFCKYWWSHIRISPWICAIIHPTAETDASIS